MKVLSFRKFSSEMIQPAETEGEDVVAVSADLLAALTGYGEVGDVAALEIVVGVGEQSLIDVGHDLAVAGFVVVVDEYPP